MGLGANLTRTIFYSISSKPNLVKICPLQRIYAGNLSNFVEKNVDCKVKNIIKSMWVYR